MFPNTPQQPNQPPTNPYPAPQSVQPQTPPSFNPSFPPAQPPVTPPQQPKNKKKLLVIGIIAAVVVVGILLWLFVFSGSGKSSSNSSVTKQGGTTKGAAGTKLDCYGEQLANAGAWNDALIGLVGVGGVWQICPVVGLEPIRLSVESVDVERSQVFAIVVEHKDLQPAFDAGKDSPEPAHVVTISNIEAMLPSSEGSGMVAHSADAEISDPTIISWLSDAAPAEWPESIGDSLHSYWKKVYGELRTFDDYHHRWSGQPIQFSVGPVFETKELNPDAGAPGVYANAFWDLKQVVYFSVDPGNDLTARDVAFIKFDVTLDGNTVTVAYQNDRSLSR